MIETDALGAGRGTLVLFLGKSLNLFFSLILFLSQFFFFLKYTVMHVLQDCSKEQAEIKYVKLREVTIEKWHYQCQ